MDGATVVDRVIRRQPPVWIAQLNSTDCRFVHVLLKTAKRLEDSLVVSWRMMQLGDSSFRGPLYKPRKRRAYIAENDQEQLEDVEGEEEEKAEVDQEREVHAARSSTRGTDHKFKYTR